ncbi:MAG: ribonuclease J [Christensenellaceae bacterium]|nr:ribonuclease J [Christensenellaceae bacterium]
MSKKQQKHNIRITPLGGVGEIGKNMTVIEYGSEMIVIDCGLCFPREDMLGVDYVIPDITYLTKNKEKIKAVLITHGHEDHIGATPYLLPEIGAPVYGTDLTLALIETKLAEHKCEGVDLNVIKAGDTITVGVFKIEAIRVTHSIDASLGFAIHTPAGTIVHTGDFKVDYTPVDGRVIDIAKFAQLGEQGVLALLSDSTNAENPGYTMSESKVGDMFENYFKNATGRIIVATFASNIHRLQQVISASKRYGRKVCLTGRSMLKIAKIAKELGYLDLDEDLLIEPEEVEKLKKNKVVILTTGSQGETMSGLVRMAAGEHKKLSMIPGDLVIISSTPIPGNEKYVSDVINMLYRRGASVINESVADVHVSGHACEEELKMMITLTKPRFFIPVHGEYRHLYRHAALAEELGIPRSRIFIPEIGKVIELGQKFARETETVPSGSVIIDGLGVGDVGNVVLRDRRLLSQDGLFIVVVTMSSETGELISGPEIISRGFVYMRESTDLLERARKIIVDEIDDCVQKQMTDWTTLKGRIKKALRAYLYDLTKRSPMILPIIIDI